MAEFPDRTRDVTPVDRYSDASAPCPEVSGAAVARALRRVGLEARIGGAEHVVLFRNGVEVGIVPLCERVHPIILRALLRTLGIRLEELAHYLGDEA